MAVFVAGATGILGRRVVQALVAKGIKVIGLSRSKKNESLLKDMGAEPRTADLFKPKSLEEATAGCEVVLHLATKVPPGVKPSEKDWEENDKIRTQGTKNLLKAAEKNGAKCFIQQSAMFIYGDHQGRWIDEKATCDEDPPYFLETLHELEDIVYLSKIPYLILRFGWFYAVDSVQTLNQFKLVKKGLFPVIGKGDAFWNFIHVDDAAKAVVAAVQGYASTKQKIYNIVDDEPVTYEHALNFLAEYLKVSPPKHVPALAGKLLMGGDFVRFLSNSCRCKNEAAKKDLGWKPEFSSYKKGFPVEIDKWFAQRD